MNTSRWIERSASTCTRTPRWAVWRLTQSPKCRAAASSMPATPSTSHAARAAMLAMTSLATRTAPRVAASPIPRSLRPLYVGMSSSVDPDQIAALDEQRNLDLGPGLERGGLGGARNRVALEAWVCRDDAELDDDGQLDADQAIVVAEQVGLATFLQKWKHVLEHVIVDGDLVVRLRVHEVVMASVRVQVRAVMAVDADGPELVAAAEALLEDRAGQNVAQLGLDDGAGARELDVLDADDGQQAAVHLEHGPVAEVIRADQCC